jgi:hypothetical protein
MVTAHGSMVVLGSGQLDAGSVQWLATHLGGCIVANRQVRVTQPQYGAFRVEITYQTDGLQIDRIDPAERTSLATPGYSEDTESGQVFNAVIEEIIRPRIARTLNAAERLAIAQALSWDVSNNDPPLSGKEFVNRLKEHNPSLGRELEDMF